MSTSGAGRLFTLTEITSATSGRLVMAGSRSDVRSVVIDSRLSGPGALFIPLPGRRFDGHQFISDAADRRSTGVLVSQAVWQQRSAALETMCARHGTGIVVVNDPLDALQRLACLHMRRAGQAVRIGITGSNGKTTTKEIIASVLSQSHVAHASAGNLNSEIGLPLSAFAVSPVHQYAVFEMAMNHAGEMDVLAEIVKPDIGLVTNVGVAHVGLLGSKQAIANEKKKIFKYFDGRQTAFIREREPFLQILAEGIRGRLVTYGPESTPGYSGSENLGLDGTVIHWEETQIRFPLIGYHNLQNALAAISVGIQLGLPTADIRRGLEAVEPAFARAQVVRGPMTIIQDCYNANTDAVQQILSFVDDLQWPGRKIAVLGAMLELGDDALQEHAKVLDQVISCSFAEVFLVGEEYRSGYERAVQARAHPRLTWAAGVEAVQKELATVVREGDLVLLKGSRALEMERILPQIMRREERAMAGEIRGS